jgi:hypothetical protein
VFLHRYRYLVRGLSEFVHSSLASFTAAEFATPVNCKGAIAGDSSLCICSQISDCPKVCAHFRADRFTNFSFKLQSRYS